MDDNKKADKELEQPVIEEAALMGQPKERMVMMVSKKVLQDKEIVVMKTKVLMTGMCIRIRMGTKLQNGMVSSMVIIVTMKTMTMPLMLLSF